MADPVGFHANPPPLMAAIDKLCAVCAAAVCAAAAVSEGLLTVRRGSADAKHPPPPSGPKGPPDLTVE